MSNPYGAPNVPPPRRRTGLYIALGCGCLLLAAVVLAVAGGGVWFLSRGSGGEEPTPAPTTTIESDGPIETPVETETGTPTADGTDPTDDPGGDTFTLTVSSPEEGTTLETSDETLTTENGKFVGVAVTITNHGDQVIGLAGDNFRFYDDQGDSYPLRYASFTTSGPELPGGEEATALLYADVPVDMVPASISYTDQVATGGQEISFPVG